MYVVCFVVYLGLLFILVFAPSRLCVLTERLKKFSTFCHFSFEGGGGGAQVKKETKGIKFFIRH